MTAPNFSLIADMLRDYRFCSKEREYTAAAILEQVSLIEAADGEAVTASLSDYEQARSALAEWLKQRDLYHLDVNKELLAGDAIMLFALDAGHGPTIVTAGQLRALIAGPAQNEDTEQLHSELANVLADWNSVRKAAGSPTNGGLVGHVAALSRNAARYQWLCSKAAQKIAYDVFGNGGHWTIGFFSEDSRQSLDAAIDAAMPAQQESGNG